MEQTNILPLPLENGYHIVFDERKILLNATKLEEFTNHHHTLSNLGDAKKVMMAHEIKATNEIEGIFDDVIKITEIIKKKSISTEEEKRIMNVYYAYQYILSKKTINEDNLRQLYQIISKDLISQEDTLNMGLYYRKAPVYIFNSSNITKPPEEKVKWEKITELMNNLFNYIDSPNLDIPCANFIKAQIIHFYFVYIHPYFDCNGRTSRTLAMWYLLNNNEYQYLTFNRAIAFNKNSYYKTILDTIKFGNINYFLNYLLLSVKHELEKEEVIKRINSDIGYKLRSIDNQTLNYILNMNGIKSLADFIFYYKHFNQKISNKEIYEEMIKPLIDLNVLVVSRYTKKEMFLDSYNFIFEIKDLKDKIDADFQYILH